MHWCRHEVLHDGQCNYGAGLNSKQLREEMEKEFPTAVAFRDPSKDAAYGRKTHVGYFRSSFTAENASWAGFKGGQNHFDDHGSDSHNNHGHLDLGHFVFEMSGQRWAVSIGSGQYDYPDLSYFGRFRFGYYHTASFGQNTLSFDGESQSRFGDAAIVDFRGGNRSALKGPKAVVDMTNGYGGAAKVRRTLSFSEDYSRFEVEDSFENAGSKVLEWRMHTVAKITQLLDDSAVLVLGGVKLAAKILKPPGAKFSAEKLELPPPQLSTYQTSERRYKGLPIRVLKVKVPTSGGVIAVQFEKME